MNDSRDSNPPSDPASQAESSAGITILILLHAEDQKVVRNDLALARAIMRATQGRLRALLLSNKELLALSRLPFGQILHTQSRSKTPWSAEAMATREYYRKQKIQASFAAALEELHAEVALEEQIADLEEIFRSDRTHGFEFVLLSLHRSCASTKGPAVFGPEKNNLPLKYRRKKSRPPGSLRPANPRSHEQASHRLRVALLLSNVSFLERGLSLCHCLEQSGYDLQIIAYANSEQRARLQMPKGADQSPPRLQARLSLVEVEELSRRQLTASLRSARCDLIVSDRFHPLLRDDAQHEFGRSIEAAILLINPRNPTKD